jgi:hypothetical protein
MHMQGVQAGSIVNTYKVCGHAFIVWLQCDVITMDQSTGTATVPK